LDYRFRCPNCNLNIDFKKTFKPNSSQEHRRRNTQHLQPAPLAQNNQPIEEEK
jgi:hypothetical protein